MKLIRKQAKKIALLLSISLMFVSCSQYDDNSTDPQANEVATSLKRNAKITGEELFKSIVFSDGVLASELPSLMSISNINQLTDSELVKYREMEEEAVTFLKNIDVNYFNKFQEKMYTTDPETISLSLKQIVTDLIPFINSKLALQNLSIDKITTSLKKDANGSISIESANTQMKEMCAVWVIGLVAVAVVVLAVVAIATVAVVGDSLTDDNYGDLTLTAVSIQTAQALK